MSHLSISAVRANALFASALQPSAEPSVMQIRQAIAEAIGRYGGHGCPASAFVLMPTKLRQSAPAAG